MRDPPGPGSPSGTCSFSPGAAEAAAILGLPQAAGAPGPPLGEASGPGDVISQRLLGGGCDGGWGVMVASGGIASAGAAPGCSCFWASPRVCRQLCSALWVPQVPPAQGCFL